MVMVNPIDEYEKTFAVPIDNIELKKIKKYFPITDDLYYAKMNARLRADHTFKRCFKVNLTTRFFNSYHKIVNEGFGHKQNNIIFVSGDTGCQPTDSLVKLWNGKFEKIQNITTKHIILSFDNDNKPIPARVIDTKKYYCKSIYQVININKLHQYYCSDNHIIPVHGETFEQLTRKFVQAKDIPDKPFFSAKFKHYQYRPSTINVRKTTKESMVYGFTLDSPTSLYVTDNDNITHNSGKSIATLSMLKQVYNDNFSYKNIFFYDQQILENLHKFPENSVIMRDENTKKGNFGMGSRRVSSQVDQVADTCRKHGLSLVFIEPEFRLSAIAKWYIETIDYGGVGLADSEGEPILDKDNQIQDYKRVVRAGLREPKTLQFLGYILIPIVDENDEDWIKYNHVKDKFIEGVRKSDLSQGKLNIYEVAEKILDEMDVNIYKNSSEKKLFIMEKYPNLTISEITTLLSALKIVQRKRKNQEQEDETE